MAIADQIDDSNKKRETPDEEQQSFADLIKVGTGQDMGGTPPTETGDQKKQLQVIPPSEDEGDQSQSKGKPKDKDTPTDKANKDADPKTEGDKQDEMAYIELDGQEYSSEQLKGTLSRYKALNHQHQQLKPLIGAFSEAMKAGATGEQISTVLQSMAKGEFEMPETKKTGKDDKSDGDDAEKQKKTSKEMEGIIKKYEDEVGVPMPQEMKDAMMNTGKGDSKMEKQIETLTNMVSMLMQSSEGVANVAKEQVAKANQKQSEAIQKEIDNNLNWAQEQTGVSDDDVDELLAFMAIRGFTMDEMQNRNTALTVFQDFKREKDEPEVKRRLDAHKKRIGAKKTMGSGSAGGSGQSGGNSGDNSEFTELLEVAGKM